MCELSNLDGDIWSRNLNASSLLAVGTHWILIHARGRPSTKPGTNLKTRQDGVAESLGLQGFQAISHLSDMTLSSSSSSSAGKQQEWILE